MTQQTTRKRNNNATQEEEPVSKKPRGRKTKTQSPVTVPTNSIQQETTDDEYIISPETQQVVDDSGVNSDEVYVPNNSSQKNPIKSKPRQPKQTSRSKSTTSVKTYNNEPEVMNFKRKGKLSTENLKLPNIHTASNLEVLSRGMMLYGRRFKNKETERLVDNSIVPKLKPEFESMNKYKRPTAITQVEYKPADEVLTNDYEFEANELVYLNRDEIKRSTNVELPAEDITNAIHYYVAHRIKNRLGLSDEEYNEKFSRIFDGSSLLALSTLVTCWVEDKCGEDTYKAYMEEVKEKSKLKLSSIDEFIRVYDESSSSDEDGDESNSSDEEVSGDSSDSSDDEKKNKLIAYVKKEENDHQDYSESEEEEEEE